MGEPIELRQNSLMGVKMGLSIQLLSGGVAEPGRLLEGPGGRRLFYGQIGNDCIFIGADMSPGAIGKLGRIYSQGRGSFSMTSASEVLPRSCLPALRERRQSSAIFWTSLSAPSRVRAARWLGASLA